MLAGRSYGILLPVFSLPSKYGVGDFGPEVRNLVDLLKELGACCWQILPLVPTSLDKGNSPYSSESSFALNSLFLSPDDLAEDGLIPKSIPNNLETHEGRRVRYSEAYRIKRYVVDKAYSNYKDGRSISKVELDEFEALNEYWLRDYALFRILREMYGSPWSGWPLPYKRRDRSALEKILKEHRDRYEYIVFEQLITWMQWERLKTYARTGGVTIIGDIPYYVDYDSADVWANQELFKLDEKGNPLYVGGVPPDMFSDTGQLWATPATTGRGISRQASTGG